MILDICKFCCLYILVLFAFSCGNHWLASTYWLFIFIRRILWASNVSFSAKIAPAGVELEFGPNLSRKIIFVRDESTALVLCWSREETMSRCEYFFHSQNIVLESWCTNNPIIIIIVFVNNLIEIVQDIARQRFPEANLQVSPTTPWSCWCYHHHHHHHHKDHHQLDERRSTEETMGPLTSTTAWLTGNLQSIASSETSIISSSSLIIQN